MKPPPLTWALLITASVFLLMDASIDSFRVPTAYFVFLSALAGANYASGMSKNGRGNEPDPGHSDPVDDRRGR